ncbi:TetR/AcrR family transcriptional regulator [Nocardia carnea]|uniref:TetR/AcrR family transcriptional regulator n=1 Tax=Nocardia carnea TaxID=37328 RepID=UPI002457B6E5|nr:TetR/AcrR family transcriptional regulator [Nocardia carnea]
MKDTARRRTAELVDAAGRVFYRKGYGDSAVQDVADEVGLLKGSVYHYIKTKEDLLFAVVEQAHTASMDAIERLRQLDVDPATELAAFVESHLRMLEREHVKFRVYLHDFRSLTPEHRKTVGAKRAEYSQYVEELVKRGQEEGVFTSEVGAHYLTLGILGMVNWTYEWWRDDADNPGRDDLVAAFVDMTLRSVGVEESLIAEVVESGIPAA